MKPYIFESEDRADDLTLLTCSAHGCVEPVYFIGASAEQNAPIIRWCRAHYDSTMQFIEQATAADAKVRRTSEHQRLVEPGVGDRCAIHGIRCNEGYAWQFESLSAIEQYQLDGR